MAAKGSFQATNPSKIDMTLTITMSIAEWKVVSDKLNSSASSAEWHLQDEIVRMCDAATKHFGFYEQVGSDNKAS